MLNGFFFDGDSATRHDATLTLTAHELVIHYEQQHLNWPLSGCRLREEYYPGRPLRLSHQEMPDATLSVSDTQAIEAILAQMPRLRSGTSQTPWYKTASYWVAGLGALVLLVALGLPLLSQWTAEHFPISWEKKLGNHVSKQLPFQQMVCDKPEGVEALKKIQQRLLANLDSPYNYQIKVVDHEMINAFALPGGHIVIFRGLLDNADSADEVVGVLAHEIAHVEYRHGLEGLLRNYGFGFIINAMGGGFGLELASLLLELSYSRDQEIAADQFALSLLQQEQLNSQGLYDFFYKVSQQEGAEYGDKFELLSTHPAFATRLSQFSEQTSQQDYPALLSSRQWQSLKGICEPSPETNH